MSPAQIIALLPYEKPFLFVEELLKIDENGVSGTFTFTKSLDFYTGHFKDYPVTPGVILTECCAQIGVVCLGIYLMGSQDQGINLLDNDADMPVKTGENPHDFAGDDLEVTRGIQIGMSSSQMEFLLPVFPDEKVTVTSEKLYYRFHKLKCAVKMYNTEGKLVCKGEIAGMIKSETHG